MKGHLGFWPHSASTRTLKKIGTWMPLEIIEVSRDGLSLRHWCYLSI
jgi:hypothetical protein